MLALALLLAAVPRDDGHAALRVVSERPMDPAEMFGALGLPDAGVATAEGCASGYGLATAIVWIHAGATTTAEVDASDPALKTCLVSHFSALPATSAWSGATAALVLRLGEWTAYTPFARPGPFTKAHVAVDLVGGGLSRDREPETLATIDARLSVLAEDLAACTPGTGDAVARLRIAGGRVTDVTAAGSTPALGECARRVFATERSLGDVSDTTVVVGITWM
jgi:hypothetical protein